MTPTPLEEVAKAAAKPELPGFPWWIVILGGVIIILVFSLGLGLFFGAVNVRFRDAENIVELLLLLATWASPVLYFWTMVASVLPEWGLRVYLLNPITQAVELFHYGFWYPIANGDPSVVLPPDLAVNTL